MLDEINDLYDEYMKELLIREKRLKDPIEFTSGVDDLLLILGEVKDIVIKDKK